MKEFRTCTREGCTRKVYARGKCVSHFNSMIKSLRRQGSDLFAAVDTWTEVQKYMPGTIYQLAQRSEISYNTVMKCINRQRAAGLVHIGDTLPPQKQGGGRWVSIFAVGPGVDHVVTPEQKADHARAMRRQQRKEKYRAKKGAMGVMVAALSGGQP